MKPVIKSEFQTLGNNTMPLYGRCKWFNFRDAPDLNFQIRQKLDLARSYLKSSQIKFTGPGFYTTFRKRNCTRFLDIFQNETSECKGPKHWVQD